MNAPRNGRIFVALTLLIIICPAGAATVVNCNETGLRAAIASGGIVTFSCDEKITITSAINIAKDVVIDGSGHNVVISGDGSSGLFTIASGVKAGFGNLTLANGGGASGGAILNLGGTVSLSNVALTNNILRQRGFGADEMAGGAICNLAGTLWATNCLFSGNEAGLPSTMNLSGNGRGGALYNSGSCLLSSCVFLRNTALGGVNPNLAYNATNALGGAVFNSGYLHAEKTHFWENIAIGGTGASAQSPSSGIPGGPAGQASGGAIFTIRALEIVACDFASNTVAGGVGGKGSMGVSSFAGSGDNGGVGGTGGIGRGGAIAASGTFSLIGTAIHHNSARGGIGGAGGAGGAGTIAGSGAEGGVGGDAFGGGVHLDSAMAQITNSTIAINLVGAGNGGPGGIAGSVNQPSGAGGDGGDGGAGGDAIGGGLSSANTFLEAGFVTIAQNGASAGVGGSAGGRSCAGTQACGSPGVQGASGAATASALANSAGTICLFASLLDSPDVTFAAVGPIDDRGDNICADASCGFTRNTSLNSAVLHLDGLADNGGPTKTMALLENSPAIDRVSSLLAPRYDQRGFMRPAGAEADSGAFEFGAPMIECPGNIITNAANGCSQKVFFNVAAGGSPAAILACSVGSQPVASGDEFTAGTNVVTCTSSNSFGVAACSFTITVLDLTPPSLTCLPEVIQIVEPGTTEAIVTWDEPSATDCSAVTVTCTPSSGSIFPYGTTPVVCVATDAHGNTNTCEFNVIVAEQAPETHDLAIIRVRAPRVVSLSANRTSVTRRVVVTVQNRSPHAEMIEDVSLLGSLVTLDVRSLDGNVASDIIPVPLQKWPQRMRPFTVRPRKTFNVYFDVTFNGVVNPDRGIGQEDFEYAARVDHGILGAADTHPECDICPRGPVDEPNPDARIRDRGCGVLRGDAYQILTDIVVR